MAYSIAIFDYDTKYESKTEVTSNAKPVPPSNPSKSNWSFEESVLEAATATNGDMVRVVNHATHQVYEGCLFPFHFREVKCELHDWYAETALISGLIGVDGTPCKEFEAIVFYVDDKDRVNDVHLVPKGCPVDSSEHLNYDPRGANPPSSPRKRRIHEAFSKK